MQLTKHMLNAEKRQFSMKNESQIPGRNDSLTETIKNPSKVSTSVGRK